MKRYEPCYNGNGDPAMAESPNGKFYSRADLIAAGVLVPVPDGDACRIQDVDERHHFIDSDGDLDFIDEGSVFVFPDTIVQRVRLVRLEDVG